MGFMESVVSEESLARAREEFERYRWTCGIDADDIYNVEQALAPMMPELVEAVLSQKYKPLPMFWNRERVTRKTLNDAALRMFDCLLGQSVHDNLFPLIEPLGAQPYELAARWCEDGERVGAYLRTCLRPLGSGLLHVVAIDVSLGYGERLSASLAQKVGDTIPDKRFVSLVSKALVATGRAQDAARGKMGRATFGPLHHLLREIALQPLLGDIESRNIAYARHNGEVRLFLPSRKNAERCAESYANLLSKKLHFADEDFAIEAVSAEAPSYWGYAVRLGGDAQGDYAPSGRIGRAGARPYENGPRTSQENPAGPSANRVNPASPMTGRGNPVGARTCAPSTEVGGRAISDSREDDPRVTIGADNHNDSGLRTECAISLDVSDPAIRELKVQLKRATERSAGEISNARRAANVSRITDGFAMHFRYIDRFAELDEIDEWLCRRIRMDYFKRWKTPKGKINGLVAFGIPIEEARKAGGTHLGWWAASDLPTLKKALNRGALRKEGYLLLKEALEKQHVGSGELSRPSS